MFYNGGSFFHCACIIAYRDMKHLESSESTQIKAMVTRHQSGHFVPTGLFNIFGALFTQKLDRLHVQ